MWCQTNHNQNVVIVPKSDWNDVWSQNGLRQCIQNIKISYNLHFTQFDDWLVKQSSHWRICAHIRESRGHIDAQMTSVCEIDCIVSVEIYPMKPVINLDEFKQVMSSKM